MWRGGCTCNEYFFYKNIHQFNFHSSFGKRTYIKGGEWGALPPRSNIFNIYINNEFF